MAGLDQFALLLLFISAAIVTWVAGVTLAKATDVLDDRFGLGEAIGGMILLSVAGSLPELAIMLSAVTSGHLDIAAGNLIGGVAMQTFVLVIADWFGRGRPPLSTAAASLIPALEGMLVIGLLGFTVMGGLLPATASIGPISVASIGIVITWFAGMIILNRLRNRPDMILGVAVGSAVAAPTPAPETAVNNGKHSTRRTIVVFLLACVATLAAGVLLEQTGNALADKWGINGVLFGATFLALATSLPEISSGITGVRMQRYTLVFGDMFGGNAVQLTLFLLADLIAGKALLPAEGAANAWIGMTGLVMTAVFVAGIIIRPSRRIAGLGPDSWVVLILYLFGLWGLVIVSQ